MSTVLDDRSDRIREFIQSRVDRMKKGQRMDVFGPDFRDAFRPGFPTIYTTSIEAFLSEQIGSAYGCVQVYHEMHRDVYTISKHPAGKRVYVDPDRRHLYRRQLDGSLEFIGNNA